MLPVDDAPAVAPASADAAPPAAAETGAAGVAQTAEIPPAPPAAPALPAPALDRASSVTGKRKRQFSDYLDVIPSWCFVPPNATSPVWNVFKKELFEGKVARCMLKNCGDELKASGGSTTALSNHLDAQKHRGVRGIIPKTV
jgi:hypothetical protein